MSVMKNSLLELISTTQMNVILQFLYYLKKMKNWFILKTSFKDSCWSNLFSLQYHLGPGGNIFYNTGYLITRTFSSSLMKSCTRCVTCGYVQFSTMYVIIVYNQCPPLKNGKQKMKKKKIENTFLFELLKIPIVCRTGRSTPKGRLP